MSRALTPRVLDGICRWCDQVADDRGHCTMCDDERCADHARWSICDLSGPDDEPIVERLVCSAHLVTALNALDWTLDVVHVYDIGQPVGAS